MSVHVASLPLDEQEVVLRARHLAQERFAPRAPHHDETGEFPFDDYRDLAENGLLGMPIPKQYGGLGLSTRTYCMVLAELAKGNGATALTLNMHSSVMRILNVLATEEQKRFYFGEVMNNGKFFATLTSEPATSFRGKFTFSTLGKPVDGGYLLNGTKHFCSLSGAASYYLVWSLLEGSESVRKGLLTTVVPLENPGLKIQKTWNSMAMRATNSDSIQFTDCFVPESDRMGEPGEALLKNVSDVFTLGYAALYLGIAEAAFEFTCDYARTRTFKPDPNPISHQPTIQRHAAEMDVAIAAAKLLVLEAADVYDNATDRTEIIRALNRAKYLACETALSITDRCLRIVGGRGVTRGVPLERYIRDVRAGVVMPPNSDACLDAIGRIAMGLGAPDGIYGE